MNPTTLPPPDSKKYYWKKKESGGFLYKKRDIRHRSLLRRKSLYMPILFIKKPRFKLVFNLGDN